MNHVFADLHVIILHICPLLPPLNARSLEAVSLSSNLFHYAQTEPDMEETCGGMKKSVKNS